MTAEEKLKAIEEAIEYFFENDDSIVIANLAEHIRSKIGDEGFAPNAKAMG